METANASKATEIVLLRHKGRGAPMEAVRKFLINHGIPLDAALCSVFLQFLGYGGGGGIVLPVGKWEVRGR